jgi:cobalamin biosynthesis Mg chelatase CobN
MEHGYAGARTMGQEFLENLWGWQVTRPDLIQQWAWDEVKQTYFDDKQKLGLPRFLGQGHNAHVKAQMLAIFMVAAEKGFWQADDATLKQMGGELCPAGQQERPARQRPHRTPSSDVELARQQARRGRCRDAGCGARQGPWRRCLPARNGRDSATARP